MKVLKPSIFPRLVLFLLLGILLVGCSQVFPSAQGLEVVPPTPTATEPPTEVPIPATELAEEAAPTVEPALTEAPTEEMMEETGTPALDPPPTDTEALTATPSGEVPTEAPANSTTLGSSELHATDPTTVNLASGKVQLVEFFAFW